MRIWVWIGWLVWCATIAASASINWLAGHSFGRSGPEAYVFATLGLAADSWKAIGPIIILSLWRAQARVLAGVASTLWCVCFLYAVFAALGLAAHTRANLTGERASLVTSYATVMADLERAVAARERLADTRAESEVAADMAALLARPVRNRGTVGSVSDDCKRDNWRTRSLCAEYANLRQERAKTQEAARVEQKLADLHAQAVELRARGGNRPLDPQARLITRLSGGHIPESDVGLLVILLLVTIIELTSAFAPVILREARTAGNGTETVKAKKEKVAEKGSPNRKPRAYATRELYEFVQARVEPREHGSVTPGALFDDYAAWRASHGRSTTDPARFFAAFERLTRTDLKEWVARKNGYYTGFVLRPPEVVTGKRTAREKLVATMLVEPRA